MAKATAKIAKAPRSGSLYVSFEILQNGATLLNAERRVRRKGALALTAEGQTDLTIPYYPLPNQRHEFLRFDHGVPVLIAAHKWEGFCTSKGELIDIVRTDKGRREIPLHKGDYASICYEDLRVMVRIGPRRVAAKAPAKGTKSGYRRGLINHFFPTIEEKRMTLVGLMVASVIVGGFLFGLAKRPVVKPTRFDEITDTYMLPFVAPDHLRHGPEALQDNLDRRQLARSVIDYYQATTAILMGWEGGDARYLQPTSIELYQRLHADAAALRAEKFRRQEEVDRLQEMKSAAAIVAVPAVQGESMTGGMLRAIDKVVVMHQSFADILAAKREVGHAFSKDPEYSYDEYKSVNASKNEKAAEYLSKIRPWGRTPDEELMYREAEALAVVAARQQRKLTASRGSHPTSTPQPIGLGEGARFASFAYAVDFRLADEKLAKLEASEYGTAQPASGRATVREPLVGEIERDLIERFIQQHKFQLQLCYELALKRNELASGMMEWRWRIDSRGTISEIALVSSSIRDQRMTQCIRDKIAQWRFPRPRRGSVEISYPFEFAPSRG